MTTRVRTAVEADRAAWDALVAAHPAADPLQAWAWGDVNGRHGERPLRLVSEADEGLVGLAQVLLRPTTAGRTVGYVPHGPIWRRDRPADLDVLLGGIRDAAAASVRSWSRSTRRAEQDDDRAGERPVVRPAIRRADEGAPRPPGESRPASST